MHRLLLTAALLGLVACAESEPPDIRPADDEGEYNLIDPVTAVVGEEEAPAIGDWVRSLQDERPVLQFGPANTEPLFSIRCDDREGILLHRHGTVATGAAEMMTITLGTASRRLALNPVQGLLPMLRAAVPANDPLLAALRGHDGSIEIIVGDGPPLVLPPSPLIDEFIATCAGGEAPAAGANANTSADDAGNVAESETP